MKRVLFLLPLLLAAAHSLEVQRHGLLFEKWLRDTFFGGYEPESHTQKWDIPASANTRFGNIPVNPKTARHGSPIGLGDALRQYDIDEPFLLIAGFWQQTTPALKTWTNVQAVRVDPTAWRKLWHPITRADLEKLETVIKDKSLSLEQARQSAQEIKSRPPFTLAVMQVNPKIDSSQRRLQCSLRFTDFFTHLAPQASTLPQKQPQIFGVDVPRGVPSAPRQF
ncbi:MAG: hypothetical protein HS117_16500 [Verrucomicrobiaceae bacterium]|nr:hypothetical protein [Verrucomicrobiaceae bacterium]